MGLKTINGDVNITGAIKHNGTEISYEGGSADLSVIVTPYSNQSTYTIGDLVSYENKFYICKTAISTAEDFNSAKWFETTLGMHRFDISNSSGTFTDEEYAKLSSDLYYVVVYDWAILRKRNVPKSSFENTIEYSDNYPNDLNSSSSSCRTINCPVLKIKSNKTWTYTVYTLRSYRFDNVTANNWVEDNTYADQGFIYKCDVTCTGLSTNDYVDVFFDIADDISGNYFVNKHAKTNAVTIYGKINTSITIPRIVAAFYPY